MIDTVLNGILGYAIKVVILVGVGFLIQYVQNKFGVENFNKYLDIARVMVRSVEQEIGAGMGADKKSEVTQSLKNISKGKLSDEMISKLIESAVYEMNHENQQNK